MLKLWCERGSSFVLKLPSFPLSPGSKLRSKRTYVLKLPSFPLSPGSKLSNNGTYFCTKINIFSPLSWF